MRFRRNNIGIISIAVAWLTGAVLAACSFPQHAQAQDPLRLTEGPFVILHSPRSVRLAQRTAQIATSMQPFPGIDPARWSQAPIEIALAPTESAFQQLSGGFAPEWGAGLAFPADSKILIPAYASERGAVADMPRILRHEVAHIALYRAVDGTRVPRWFNEGYATFSAGQLDAEAGWLLRLSFLAGRAPPLDSLDLDWPTLTGDARLAYLLSASAVDYLSRASGERGLRRLIDLTRTTRSFDAALRQTYGLDMSSLEREWRKDVKKRYGWIVVLSQGFAFGGVIGAIIIVLWFVRKRRDRKRMAALKANEMPDNPAFWVNESGIEIIAHRGFSSRAPENTIAAMEFALRRGSRSLEFDLHVSKDGIPVVIHDATLERTTNGSGPVRAMTYEELRTLDAGQWFSPMFYDDRVPSLEDLLSTLIRRVDRLYVELKAGAFRELDLETVIELLIRYGFADKCVIMSFQWEYLHYIRSLDLPIPIAFLADDVERYQLALREAVSAGNALVDCNYRILIEHPDLATKARDAGIDLAVYTVDDIAAASTLAKLGVRRITTNEPEKLLRWAVGQGNEG